MYCRAIADSIAIAQGSNGFPTTTQPEISSVANVSDVDQQLHMALELSKQQVHDDEIRRKKEEEELEMILKLSITEK